MITKICSICGLEKLLTDFYFRKDKNDYRHDCKECGKKRDKRKRENPEYYEIRKEYDRRYYHTHKKECHERTSIRRRKFRETHPERYIWMHIRNKCRKKNIPFNFEVSDIIIPKYCPILGIELKMGNLANQDNAASVDRAIPALGYVKGNVSIMSKRANTIKNDGTAEEHEKIAAFIRKMIEQNKLNN